jgi:streptogramin lyase
VLSDIDSISQIDASGTKVIKTVKLPGTVIGGIAVGGGSVWVADQSQNRLLRVDPTSGTITGTTQVGGVVDEFLPIAYSNGAVYVPTQDFELRRVDASTMKITAAVSTPSDGSWFVMSVGADGDIWAEPAQGVIDDLDPVTLGTKRAIQLQPTTRDGGTFGVVATSTRVYEADGDDGYVLSFPLS